MLYRDFLDPRPTKEQTVVHARRYTTRVYTHEYELRRGGSISSRLLVPRAMCVRCATANAGSSVLLLERTAHRALLR